MPPKLLTKTRYINGLQCLKYLWMIFHEQEKIAETDAGTQYLFDQGHNVGELAKRLFPGGIDNPPADFMGSIRRTQQMIRERQTIFEAAVMSGNLYSRVDILRPADDGEGWDIIEVKSSTRVKEVDVEDVAFQKYCCTQAGLDIRSCYLVHINTDYVRQGDIEPEKLFANENIDERVAEVYGNVADRVDTMLETISAENCPDIVIGSHCRNPYECPVNGCDDFLPEDSVMELYRGGRKGYELLENGILSINDIPETFELTGSQQIQKETIASGQPHIEWEEISGFLNALVYPLYYFDFETFSMAIPPFDGTRPYQNIPFQFSLHVAQKPGGQPEHFAFLAEGPDDPRPALLAELQRVLGESGNIVVYNQSFEAGVLRELGEAFPEYAEWVSGVTERLVDLFVPFRRLWYYHPAQKGSASLKKVLPAVTGKSYEGMDIDNGEAATISFQRVTYGKDVSEEEREKVRRDLLEYCKLDTEGMVWIVEELGKLGKYKQGKLF